MNRYAFKSVNNRVYKSGFHCRSLEHPCVVWEGSGGVCEVMQGWFRAFLGNVPPGKSFSQKCNLSQISVNSTPYITIDSILIGQFYDFVHSSVIVGLNHSYVKEFNLQSAEVSISCMYDACKHALRTQP